MNTIITGDCRDVMRTLIADGVKVQCVVTSPPYWRLRDYGVPGQLGLEPTIGEYLDAMVGVFDLVRDLMADDAVLWLNMGDSYIGSNRGGQNSKSGLQGSTEGQNQSKLVRKSFRRDREPTPRSDIGVPGLKPKDMAGVPWRLAFALQDAGWWLRQDIIWHKPNPMPETVSDRCTKAHEYVFLLSKSMRYYYDADAIAEPVSPDTHARAARGRSEDHKWADGGPGNHTLAKVPPSGGHVAGVNPKAKLKAVGGWAGGDKHDALSHQKDGQHPKTGAPRHKQNESFSAAVSGAELLVRNKRSVWTIPTQPYPESHFATFPEALVEPCVLAGSRAGDIVFDPFMGSGTVAQVAQRLGRQYLGCDLNPKNEALQAGRISPQGAMAFA